MFILVRPFKTRGLKLLSSAFLGTPFAVLQRLPVSGKFDHALLSLLRRPSWQSAALNRTLVTIIEGDLKENTRQLGSSQSITITRARQRFEKRE